MSMLDSITVLDVTQVVSGSFASMNLADLGADVIKIERPLGGDVGRHNPPFVGEYSAYFTAVNRNKQSVALDLKSDEGQEIFLDLLEEADVVMENFKPGTMASFGLDYDSIVDNHPDIVYCSITGFGHSGPYRNHPALDIVAQAISGSMSITGPPDSKPYRAGIPIADIAGSMYATQSVIAALFERERTGHGTNIDVSMLDSIISWLTVRVGYTFATGDPYPRMGNRLDEFIPYGVFETADSHLAIVVVGDHHWVKLCNAIDRPDLADDDRFRTVDDRRANRAELEAILEEVLETQSTTEWFDTLLEYGVPSGPVYDTEELWEDPHVRARNLRSTVSLDSTEYPIIEYPVKFGNTETSCRRGVPKVGAQSRAILSALGYPEDTIEQYVEDGVVGVPESGHPNRP